ncbi:MAG TPA: Asp-tRNA(Asn)/Glu-tRNA(Gln) amidotransferase subunit GatC [Longimicrobiales bacterium]
MAVTPADVMYIAQLARLDLTPEEIERFTPQLNRVLEHAAELAEVDVGGVAPVGGVAEWTSPLRADVPGADNLALTIEQLSEFVAAGFFTVPRLPVLGTEQQPE